MFCITPICRFKVSRSSLSFLLVVKFLIASFVVNLDLYMYNNPFFTFFVPGIFFNKSFTSSFAIFFGSATVFCFLTVPGFLAVAGFLTVPGFLAVPGFFVTPGVFGFNDGVFP